MWWKTSRGHLRSCPCRTASLKDKSCKGTGPGAQQRSKLFTRPLWKWCFGFRYCKSWRLFNNLVSHFRDCKLQKPLWIALKTENEVFIISVKVGGGFGFIGVFLLVCFVLVSFFFFCEEWTTMVVLSSCSVQQPSAVKLHGCPLEQGWWTRQQTWESSFYSACWVSVGV